MTTATASRADHGTFSVVGVGPGDPELITLKAARRIAAADVVAFPVRTDGGALAHDIAAAHVGTHQRRFGFTLPMAVAREPAQLAYDAAARGIGDALQTGADVVLLCEGDPLFYGSAMYLISRLAGRFAIEVVPGVIAPAACAARLVAPLAGRNDVFSVVPAPLGDSALQAAFAGADALAVMKVGRHFDRVRGLVRAAGREATATLFVDATTPGESITPLAAAPEGPKPYFSTILITAKVVAGDSSVGAAR